MSNSQFTIYRSSDSGAPTLNGISGSLISLLDQVLVSGYGSKSAAGWTKVLSSGATRAVYKQGDGLSGCLRVYDESILTGYIAQNGKGAYIGGAEFMSSWNETSGFFPTRSGLCCFNDPLGVLGVYKSSTSDSTAQTWKVFADNRTVYMFVKKDTNRYYAWMFGEIFSFDGDNTSRNIIIGRIADTSVISDANEALDLLTYSTIYPCSGHAMTSLYKDGAFYGGVPVGKHANGLFNRTTTNGAVPFPNSADGGIYLSPIYVHDTFTCPKYQIRGKMRGLWSTYHDARFLNDGAVVGGTAYSYVARNYGLSGRTMECVTLGGRNSTYVMETSATVETND